MSDAATIETFAHLRTIPVSPKRAALPYAQAQVSLIREGREDVKGTLYGWNAAPAQGIELPAFDFLDIPGEGLFEVARERLYFGGTIDLELVGGAREHIRL